MKVNGMRFKRQSTKPYYGWYIAVTLAITETISWGILYYSFSVFLTPMQAELKWSRAELTGGFSLALLVMGAMAFPVGVLIDRYGPRLLMTLGSICASLLAVAWSQVTNQTAFYLIWAGIGACSATVLYEPAFAVIAQWFRKHRAAALATITFVAGLASTIFLPLSDALMHQSNWRTAVLTLGLFLAAMTIPLHALMLRRNPQTLGILPDGAVPTTEGKPIKQRNVSLHDALHSRVFWLLTLSFGLASLSAAAIRVHFISYLIESGVNSTTAAFTTGTIGIMQVVGRLVFAPMERRWSSTIMVIGVFALQAIALTILVVGQSPPFIVLFIILFGTSQGATTLARPLILAELYGSSHYGRISSIMAIFLTLTSTAAPLGASLIFDRFATYRPVIWLIVILASAATGFAFLAKSAAAHFHRHIENTTERTSNFLPNGVVEQING
jgi:MFS family permease